jgi:meiotic recombination protein REC8, fungi type
VSTPCRIQKVCAHCVSRPEQLNLAEDPFFLPNFDIGFDLSAFGASSSEESSVFTNDSEPLELASSQSSLRAEEQDQPEDAGIYIPSYGTPDGGPAAFGALAGPGTDSFGTFSSHVERPASLFAEEPAIIEDPVFDVDDDGFLRPAASEHVLGELELPSVEDLPFVQDEASNGQGGHGPWPAALDDEPMLSLQENLIEAEVDATAAHALYYGVPLSPAPESGEVGIEREPSASIHSTHASSETVDAQQRVRTAKPLEPDRETELTNRVLNEWSHNYLANMAAALRARQPKVWQAFARKHADFWMLQQGIGNVTTAFGVDKEAHPLSIFSGQSLWDLLRRPNHGTKRSRSPGGQDEDDEAERRVRARIPSQRDVEDQDEQDAPLYNDDDGVALPGEEFEVEAEVGRHAPPSLPDSSALPWNLSAGGSRQSSARPPGSGLGPRMSSSLGALIVGTDFGPLFAHSRRGSRLTSASPLVGRGTPALSRHGSQELGDASGLTSYGDDIADLDVQLGAGFDPDFELYGPSATVDMQTAAQSQWLAATLEDEAYNFLTFVNTKIREKEELERGTKDEANTAGAETNITFDELLPPIQNSAIVGAQALLHVLALTTKGLLQVSQAEHFGDIQVSLVGQ